MFRKLSQNTFKAKRQLQLSKRLLNSNNAAFNSIPSLIKNQHLWRTKGYINGAWTDGDADENGFFSVHNPANGEIIANLPRMGIEESEDAAEMAMESWGTWKMTTAKERGKILLKMASLMLKYQDDLATIITLEAGKPFAESKGEVLYAASFYEFFGEEAKRSYGSIIPNPVKGRRILAIKQPVGPCALITPWNFPSGMITRKVGAALAAGCTVVIKPSEETPLSALALCAIAEEAGLPKGVMNCLTVAREDVTSVGNNLCHSNLIRKISFTGSTFVGKWLMRESSSTVKKVSLELGGNAPFIVFDDADLEVAIRALMASKFRNAGQACIASNRILVQEKIYDQFAELLTKRVSGLRCGNGFDSNTTVGPLINGKGLTKVSGQVLDCLQRGAEVLTGGRESELLNANGGTFYTPTVLTGVTREMAPFVEETFGPIAPLTRFTSEEEAISIANDSRFGLASYACTKDLARAFRVSEALESGMVGINEGAISSEMAPFGGIKESGLGREGSFLGMEEYLEVKYVCMGLGE